MRMLVQEFGIGLGSQMKRKDNPNSSESNYNAERKHKLQFVPLGSRLDRDQYDRDWPWLKSGERTQFYGNNYKYGRTPDDDEDIQDREELESFADMFDSGGHVMDVGALDALHVDRNKEAAEKYAKSQNQPKQPVFNVANFIASAAKKTEESKQQQNTSSGSMLNSDTLLAKELKQASAADSSSNSTMAENFVNVSIDSLYHQLLAVNIQALLDARDSEPAKPATPASLKLQFDNERQYINVFEPLLTAEVAEAIKETLFALRNSSRSRQTGPSDPVPISFVSLTDRTQSNSTPEAADLMEMKAVLFDEMSPADQASRNAASQKLSSKDLQKDDLIVVVAESVFQGENYNLRFLLHHSQLNHEHLQHMGTRCRGWFRVHIGLLWW